MVGGVVGEVEGNSQEEVMWGEWNEVEEKRWKKELMGRVREGGKGEGVKERWEGQGMRGGE